MARLEPGGPFRAFFPDLLHTGQRIPLTSLPAGILKCSVQADFPPGDWSRSLLLPGASWARALGGVEGTLLALRRSCASDNRPRVLPLASPELRWDVLGPPSPRAMCCG